MENYLATVPELRTTAFGHSKTIYNDTYNYQAIAIQAV